MAKTKNKFNRRTEVDVQELIKEYWETLESEREENLENQGS